MLYWEGSWDSGRKEEDGEAKWQSDAAAYVLVGHSESV